MTFTGWIPDVVADETIESVWGNSIRDRTITPFTNAAARDAAITTPRAGMVCWLADHGALFVYTGTAWVSRGRGNLGSVTVINRDVNPGVNVVHVSIPFTLPVARRCRVDAVMGWSVITATITGSASCAVGFDGNTDIRLAASFNAPVGAGLWGSGYNIQTLAAGSHTAELRMLNAGTGGSMRCTAGNGRMDLYDVGA